MFCGLYLLLQQKSLEALQATVHSLSSTSLHLRFETLRDRNEKIKINKSSILSNVHLNRDHTECATQQGNTVIFHESMNDPSTFLLAFASSES